MSKNKTPLKAIRDFCYECSGFVYKNRRECKIETCPLWPFRLGKNSLLKRKISEKHKESLINGLNKWRESQSVSHTADKPPKEA